MTEKDPAIREAIFECILEFIELGNKAEVTRRDHYYGAALELAGMRRLSTNQIDGIADYFLKRYSNPICFEMLDWAIGFVKRGASRSMTEKVLNKLVKTRAYRIEEAKHLATLLGRGLTREEIFSMVRLHGKDDSCMSESHEKELLVLVKKYLDEEALREAEDIFAAKKERWKNYID